MRRRTPWPAGIQVEGVSNVAGRVYKRGNAWVVYWQATRSASSQAEAEAMAQSAAPPPRRRTEVEPAVVAIVKRRRDEGKSYARIAAELTERGFEPPRGERWIYATLRAVAEARS